METIDNNMEEFYKRLAEKLDNIINKLDSRLNTKQLSEIWLDIQDACQLLKISKRTLQSYRDKGILPFSQYGGKIYFRANDIEDHLKRNYNKGFNKR